MLFDWSMPLQRKICILTIFKHHSQEDLRLVLLATMEMEIQVTTGNLFVRNKKKGKSLKHLMSSIYSM